MIYLLKPSLKRMSLIKIVATLCHQDDVTDLLGRFCISSCTAFQSKLVKIETIVGKKVAKLFLPKRMKEEILCLVRPVVIQILKWREFHYRCCNLSLDIPNEFYWTPQGTIDEKKTAKMMIEDKSISIIIRYTLACIYCLENDIEKLWDKIPEGSRKRFYSQEDPKLVNQNGLVVYWTYHVKEEMDKMDSMIAERMDRRCSPYQYAFELAAVENNKVASEYFLKNLTSTEREESLLITASKVLMCGYLGPIRNSTEFLKESFSNIFIFLLRELNENQQIEIFKFYPDLVLMCFLDWPLQTFFMEIANRMWNFLDKDIYCDLLLHITDKMKNGCKDFDYRQLFLEFWEQSPNDFKRHVFSVGCDLDIVYDLFKITDKNNFKLILQAKTHNGKKYLFYNDKAYTICMELMNDNQLSLLKYFIKKYLPTKGEVIKFKQYLKNGYLSLVRNWQQKFLCVLDDVICEFTKRKCEEGDSTISKRMCSAEFEGVTHRAKK